MHSNSIFWQNQVVNLYFLESKIETTLKKIALLIILIITASTLYAENTGKIINNKCRTNLKLLNESTQKMLEKHNYDLPPWRPLEVFYKETKLFEVLDKLPTPPTLDCRYYLASLGSKDYQWCCELHGVIDGDKTVSFKYHEHAMMGKINSKYEKIPEYSVAVKSMLHWTNYRQTFSELMIYHFNMNPISTILFGIFAITIVYVIYKAIY